MSERMLQKEFKPSLDEMYSIIGSEGANLLKDLDNFMRLSYDIVSEIKFPFGSNYGYLYRELRIIMEVRLRWERIST